MKIIVEEGLRSQNTEDAAKLYAEAFQKKFAKIIGGPDIMIQLLANGINPNRAITAYNNEGELLGIAGFNFDNQTLINIEKSVFSNQFGYIKGFIKYLFAKLLYNRSADNEFQLLMDGIVVHSNYRGHGIGKLLFSKLEEFASRNHLKTIKLDVIDENPKAKALYEKIGFVGVQYKKMPFIITKLAGISGITTMIKEINS